MPTIIVKQGDAVDRPRLRLGEPALSIDTNEVHVGGVFRNLEILTEHSPEKERFLATKTNNGFMDKNDKAKLDSITPGANSYTHPSTHPATMIEEDPNHRFMTDAEKQKLQNLSGGADAFSNIIVGGVTIAADIMSDTLEIVAGDNITLTPDAGTDKITIASKDTVYTHPLTHSATMIEETSERKFMTPQEKDKLSNLTQGVPHAFNQVIVNGDIVNAANTDNTIKLLAGENISLSADSTTGDIVITAAGGTSETSYIHPSTHPASMITEDNKRKFVTAEEKEKLSNLSLDGNNQNAYSHIKVGDVTLSATNATDTLEFAAGKNVTLVPNDSTGRITVNATDTIYTHPEYHPASVILQDSDHRFITDVEREKLAQFNPDQSGTPVTSAFSNVKVGSVVVASDEQTDTLELVAGNNVTITADPATDKVTISSKDTVYTHPNSHSATMITEAPDRKFMTDEEKQKLSNLSLDGNNQNAFSHVKVGNTTVSAELVTDTIELVGGKNITIEADPLTDTITINSTIESTAEYTHPVSHPASMILFKDGDSFQDKLDNGSLRGQQGTPGSQGAQGIQGHRGEQGIAGERGDTGTSIRFKGQWSSSVNYVCDAEYIDIVLYNGSSYRCVRNNTGYNPSNTSYWQIVAQKGDVGAKGDQGERGIQGIKGDDGIAGAKGDQGDQGPRGFQGEQGPKGEDGFTWRPSVDNNGNLSWEKDSNTLTPSGVNIMGPQGPRGIQGEQGQQGQTGATGHSWLPSVDSYGNLTWSRSSTTSTPPSRNIKGPQGDQGPRGLQGEQGQQGQTGAAGHSWLPSVDSYGNLSWTKSSSTAIPTSINIKGPQGEQGPNIISSTTSTSGFTNGNYLYDNNGTVSSRALPIATTASEGIVQLYGGVDSSSHSLAASSGAVKIAYDKAVSAYNLANGKANANHGTHVPPTESANNARFLRNDNTWQTITAANIGAMSKTGVNDNVSLGKYIKFYELNGNNSDSTMKSAYLTSGVLMTNFNDIALAGLTIGYEINNLKQSVSSGKQSIASAITAKGISASGSDSFATLANKIAQMPSPNIDNVGLNSNCTGYSKGLIPTPVSRESYSGSAVVRHRFFIIDSGYNTSSVHIKSNVYIAVGYGAEAWKKVNPGTNYLTNIGEKFAFVLNIGADPVTIIGDNFYVGYILD